MTPFRRLCRFVDWDLGSEFKTGGRRSISVGIGMLIVAPLALLSATLAAPAKLVALAFTIAAGLSWFGFVAWRGWRLIRATATKSDRHYDRHGKFLLPGEYAGTESATRITRRKRQEKAVGARRS